MKSERRHELQQNELAIYLNKINKSIEPYSRIIAIAVGVLIVGGIAWGLYSNQQTGKRSDATLQLLQASASQDAEDLLTVSEGYPETAAGAWARLYQGKQYLTQGVMSLYNDRENATQLLQDAQAAFNNALAQSKDRLLVSRAHFGIARAAESLGNIDEAIAAYEEVMAVNESEAMFELAQKRIDTLKHPETKEFLAWFADQDFSPPDPSIPPDLPGANVLPDLPDLSLPDLSLPSAGDGEPRSLEGGLDLPELGPEGQPGDAPANEATESEGIQLPTSDDATTGDSSESDNATNSPTESGAETDPTPAADDPAPAADDAAPAAEQNDESSDP